MVEESEEGLSRENIIEECVIAGAANEITFGPTQRLFKGGTRYSHNLLSYIPDSYPSLRPRPDQGFYQEISIYFYLQVAIKGTHCQSVYSIYSNDEPMKMSKPNKAFETEKFGQWDRLHTYRRSSRISIDFGLARGDSTISPLPYRAPIWRIDNQPYLIPI